MSREGIYKYYKPAVMSKQQNHDQAYWFVFCSSKLLIAVKSDKCSVPYTSNLKNMNLSSIRTQYLGTIKGHPCYSAEVPSETTAPEGMSFRELKPLFEVLDEDEFLLACKALQIVNWDQTNQYCGRCGNGTEVLQDERAKKCPNCGLLSYPLISPVTITAVLKGNSILLAGNAATNGKVHSIIAGFVEPGETLEECVQREILEEVGLKVKNIKYFGSQPWAFSYSLMIGFTAEYESGEILVDGTEITEAGWYDVHNLPDLPGKMSISREMIDWYIQNTHDTI
ncbi:NAD(+) diphosphatase [Chloroflexota bacterium]